MAAAFLIVSLSACSGGSSDEEKESEPVEDRPASQASVNEPERESSVVEKETDPGRLILDLDRIIRDADAQILQKGLDARSALSSQTIDELESRVRSAQDGIAKMQGM